MNWDQVTGSWNQVKGKMMTEWGKLTSDELIKAEGRRDQIIGLLQEKYGWAKDEAERKIDQFISRL
jgi:uncharacterized protein YjbJ (UPF0337 family)